MPDWQDQAQALKQGGEEESLRILLEDVDNRVAQSGEPRKQVETQRDLAETYLQINNAEEADAHYAEALKRALGINAPLLRLELVLDVLKSARTHRPAQAVQPLLDMSMEARFIQSMAHITTLDQLKSYLRTFRGRATVPQVARLLSQLRESANRPLREQALRLMCQKEFNWLPGVISQDTSLYPAFNATPMEKLRWFTLLSLLSLGEAGASQAADYYQQAQAQLASVPKRDKAEAKQALARLPSQLY